MSWVLIHRIANHALAMFPRNACSDEREEHVVVGSGDQVWRPNPKLDHAVFDRNRDPGAVARRLECGARDPEASGLLRRRRYVVFRNSAKEPTCGGDGLVVCRV
jgi:hypothetical protein